MKPCHYCKRIVIDDEEDGYIRVIHEDESITLAHTECMEMYDDLRIGTIEW